MKRMLALLIVCWLHIYALPAQTALYDKVQVTDYFQNEQYADAIEYLKTIEGTAATDISFLNNIGYAYYMLGKLPEANQYYQQALHIDSLNFTANRYADLIQTNNKNYDKALFYYSRLLRHQPSIALLYKVKGDVYVRKNLPDSALAYYATAYWLQPKNPGSYIATPIS